MRDEDLALAREVLLERERQTLRVAVGARLDRQPQLQQRVDQAALAVLEREPGLLGRGVGQVGDDLVEAAGAAEALIVGVGHRPVARGVIDLVAAQAIARALRGGAQRGEDAGGAGGTGSSAVKICRSGR